MQVSRMRKTLVGVHWKRVAVSQRRRAVRDPCVESWHHHSVSAPCGTHPRPFSSTESANVPDVSTTSVPFHLEQSKQQSPPTSNTVASTTNSNAKVTDPIAILEQMVAKKPAESCFLFLDGLAKKLDKPSIIPANLLNRVVNKWRVAFTKNRIPTNPTVILSKLEYYQKMGLARIDIKTYNMILSAIANSRNPSKGVDLAMRIFDRITSSSSTSLVADQYTFGTMLHVLAKSGHAEAPQQAEQVLETMNQLQTTSPEEQLDLYKQLLHIHANHGNVDRIQDFLQQMTSQGLEYYNILLTACAKAQDPERAEEILLQLQTMADEGRVPEGPNANSYARVLASWAQLNSSMGAKHAESLLYEMESRAIDHPNLQPDRVCYDIVVNTLAKMGDAEGAHALLGHMVHSYQAGNEAVKPDAVFCDTVLAACSRSQAPDNADRAETILEQMRELSETGDFDTQPTVKTYSSVLSCLSKLMTPDAAERAKAVLSEMENRFQKGEDSIKPNLVTYSIVLRAVANAGDLATAEQLLSKIYETGSKEDNNAIKTIMQALRLTLKGCAKSQDFDAAHRASAILSKFQKLSDENRLDAHPDFSCYESVLFCWARSAVEEAGERAEALIRDMQTRFNTGDKARKPTSKHFLAAIQAHANTGNGDRAEALFHQMYGEYMMGNESMRSDTQVFNAILFAWSVSSSPHAVDRAEKTLARMLQHYESNELDSKPNVASYNLVLSCWANASTDGSAASAEELLREMETLASNGDGDLAPDHTSYEIVISAWKEAGNLEQAQRLEDELREKSLSGHHDD
jgi:hypothetical protein